MVALESTSVLRIECRLTSTFVTPYSVIVIVSSFITERALLLLCVLGQLCDGVAQNIRADVSQRLSFVALHHSKARKGRQNSLRIGYFHDDVSYSTLRLFHLKKELLYV